MTKSRFAGTRVTEHFQIKINDWQMAPLVKKDRTALTSMSIEPDIAKRLTQQALEIARHAGLRIVDVYGGDFEVAIKADHTPVTTADMAAHDVILEELGRLDPLLPVLSEESDTISFEERHRWSAYWLVDPLDGTREFLRRNGEFSVNIALIVNNKPMAGVIVAPVLDVAYFATLGDGAYKQIGREEPRLIHVRTAARPVTVARSRCPTTGPRLQKFLDGLGEHDEIPMGSALKSCLVAEGSADIYARLGPTGEWDTAAAQCIVEEAGGYIKDMHSRKLKYNMRESLINPNFLVFGDDRFDWAQHLPPEAI